VGELTADPTYGTTIQGTAVYWPLGFTGRWAGSEIEVLDPDGKVIATTGRTYKLEGGYWDGFSACGIVTPQ